ncbi:MAG: hypothetical protein WC609_01015 [Candidatus Paceibacterota bacterium]|jgi:hypothetical protein
MPDEDEDVIGEDGFGVEDDADLDMPPAGGIEEDFGLEDPDSKYH